MLRKFIAKHIGYPLQDFITGTSINSALNRLKESQYWDESGIYEYRFSKLHLLINHAYNNVPYYKKLFDSIGLKPEDIKHLDDIKKIPILTKKIVIKENDRMLAKGFNMRLAKKGKTGGTTGSPVITYTDIYDRTYTWASYYRWYEWMGINKEDKVVTLWGAKKIINPSIKVKFKDNVAMWLQNQLVIDSFGINNNTINKLYNKIIRFNPSLLKGYLSSLITIAYYIRDKGLPVNKNLKAISSTTETLLPYYRQLLTDTFNTDIYDQYGCGEVSAISYECAKHNGMHLNMEHVLLEVLDDNDKDLINKTGRIIVTGLDNYVMP
ncbi:MAG: phenylacetate--CoA ligase family protein, partial [Bacteroidia bacterium]|nr:phenylacetate--CoA ligase family protein [Bacteroidia bacterium]